MFAAIYRNTFHWSHGLTIKVASKLAEKKSKTTTTKHEVQRDSLLHENCSISFGDNPNQIFILQNTGQNS